MQLRVSESLGSGVAIVSENVDDWFEKAIRSEADDESGDGTAESGDSPSDDDLNDAGAAEGEASDTADDGSERSADHASDETDEDESGDESLFEDDFASALNASETTDGDGIDSNAAGFGESLDVDDDPAIEQDFGVGDDSEFTDDGIDSGFGDDFGVGGGGGFDTDFDDEEFDSDLSRIELGIEGLDEMIQGGVPERSLMVAIGSAGTGKTTFGLQFLLRALEQDERAVYITLEESSERVINSATERGYDFDEYVADGQLAVVDIDPVEMANSLASIRNELPRLIEEFGATRLVLDSVSLLEMMYDDRAIRRNEIYDFTKSLKRAGITTLMTSEASEDNAYASRHGIVEYLTDAVFVLQYVRPSDFRETRLAVEIQKIRDANHSRETKPYEITNEGLSVYRQANIF